MAGNLGEGGDSILNNNRGRVIPAMKNPDPKDGTSMCDGIPDLAGQHMETMAKAIATEKSKRVRNEPYIDQLVAGRHSLAIYRVTAQICCAYMMELTVDPAALTNIKHLINLDFISRNAQVTPKIIESIN